VLHVHRASDGRRLATALADALADGSDDPFAPCTVAVPARGVERWLTQRLSHTLGAVDGDGVCANVSFPSPARLLDDVLAEVSPELGAAVEAWREEAVVWPLVRLLSDLPDAPELAAVRSYLDSSTSRRYALAAKTARLFRSYADDRPELLCSWTTEAADCPDDLRWQIHLWRLLRAQVGPSPAELHAAACDRLRAEPGRTSLPRQVLVHGLSRITRTRLDALAALAQSREVRLFVHHPGAALWDAVDVPADDRRDPTQDAPLDHPLLASLSRDVRELQQRLLRAVPDLVTSVHDDPPGDATLLQRLQRGLRTGAAPALPHEVDDSVQVHACHGPARQVEVLRDVVLGLLEADPTLEPRDVIVMCPDVETYAPLVAAAFGPSAHPAHRLRVSIADRSPRQTNPLLGLAARLLTLAGSRVTAAEVLDLAGSPGVRERFGLSDDDLEQLRGWVVGAHVHWGLDADHREAWGLAALDDGTWRRGLDRLLAGAVLGGDDPWQGVLPYDALDTAGLDLLGRTAELLDRLDHALRAFRDAHTACDWLDALGAAVDELGAAPIDAPWQQVQLRRELMGLRGHAGDAPAELADVTALLGDVLAGRPTRTSFRTGALTVCTLTPMRSVPHRVVVLLGMDDGVFPRSGLPDADDVLARDPRLGERDPRSEDRQLFLDALLAASQHLVVLYTGAHVRTGAELPPAVPVGELLDVVGTAVVTRHPLQPFDPRAFAADSPFSYDPVAHAGALAVRDPAQDPPPFLDAPVPPPQESAVELQRLVDLLLHPSKAFLRQRLEVTTTARAEEPSSELPIELDNLEQWSVGDRMLHARLAGGTRAAITAAERGRGCLPPGPLGLALLDGLGPCVHSLAVVARDHVVGDPETVDVDLRLLTGHLVGSVSRVHGRRLVTVTFSRLGPKQRLRAWVELLAVAAQEGGAWDAVLIGRAKDDSPVVETFAAPGQEQARAHLAYLVGVRAAALQSPLAVPLEAAAAYAQARKEGESVDRARDQAQKKWQSPFGWDGPDRDADHALLWGPEAPFSALWSWRSPVPLPVGAGGESSDFAQVACAVWYPLLDAEVSG
jgi:exodeoxyribonuclease V gamma subunit